VLALAGWAFRRKQSRVRIWAHVVLGAAILCLPSLFPCSETGIKAALLLCCVLPVKLWDAHLHADRWERATFGEWLRFILNPVALVNHRHVALVSPPWQTNVRDLARGILEVAAGAVLFRWADLVALGERSFWLEHAVKLVASYLLIWDGGCVTFTATWRLLGGRCVDFSIHPVVARTPAEFWRRYNRWFGQFLYEDVFKPLGGLRRPARGIVGVFALMGVVHEYQAWQMTGHITGYLLAYFALHAVVVAATFRLRPRRAQAVVGIAGTISFHLLTTVLCLTVFHDIVGSWYSHGSVLP